MLFRLKLVVFFALGVIVGFLLAFGRVHWAAYLQSFSATASSRTDLAFPVSGTLAFIMPTGKKVATGDIVAELTDRDASSALVAAQSALTVEKAKQTEIATLIANQQMLTRQAKNHIQITLIADSRRLAGTLAVASSSVSSAITKSDALFADATSSNPQLLVSADKLSAAAAESGRVAVSASIGHLVLIVGSISASSTPADVLTVATGASADLAEIQLFLESLNFLQKENSGTATSSGLLWTSNLASAQASVSGAIQSIFTDEGKVVVDQAALESAIGGVSVTQLLAEDVAEQKLVAAAQVAVSNASSTLAASVLRAPMSGTLAVPATLSALPTIGKIIIANQPVISLESGQ